MIELQGVFESGNLNAKVYDSENFQGSFVFNKKE